MRPPIDSVDDVLTRIQPGEWVLDADDKPWCLVNTHVFVEQIMWKSGTAPLRYVSLDSIPFPIYEAEMTDPACEHKRIQERGHCERCGAIVGDTEAWKHLEYGFGLPPGLTEAQQIAIADQIDAAIREHLETKR